MTEREVDGLIRSFRRQMAVSVLARGLIAINLAAAILAAGPLAVPSRQAMAGAWVLAALGGLILMVVVSVGTARRAHMAAMMAAVGRLDEAEAGLARVLRSFSIFRGTLLMACQQLGALLRVRRHDREAVKVFRAILGVVGARTRAARAIQTTVRLMWADAELDLGNLAGAYEAFRPVFDGPLSLADRLMLLPIELRYSLATGHTRAAVWDLREKVRYAELLESPQAARVHLLLAQACEREGMQAQAEFLRLRAALYHDLGALPAHPWPMGGEASAGDIQ